MAGNNRFNFRLFGSHSPAIYILILGGILLLLYYSEFLTISSSNDPSLITSSTSSSTSCSILSSTFIPTQCLSTKSPSPSPSLPVASPPSSLLRSQLLSNQSSNSCSRSKSLLKFATKSELTCQCGNGLSAGDCVEIDHKIRCLPSFVIVGAMKSGTGALLRWLGMHPNIQAGKGDGGTNEIHFFGSKAQSSSCLWESYLQHFPVMSSKDTKSIVTFDKSPDYMRSALKMTQIATFLPTIKIVMILRNPSSRAFSGFNHNCRHERFARTIHPFEHKGTTYPLKSVIRTDEEYNRNEDRSSSDGNFDEKNNLLDVPRSYLDPIPKGECTPEDFHRYVFLTDPFTTSTKPGDLSSILSPSGMVDLAIGHYDSHLEKIYSLFPAEQVLVLFQEHMNSNTLSTLRKIESFLGIPTNDYQMDSWLTTRNGDHVRPSLSCPLYGPLSPHLLPSHLPHLPHLHSQSPQSPQGISFVWKDYWKSSSSSPIHTTTTNTPSNNPLSLTSSGYFSSTRSLLDEYYRPHNTRLKALLGKYKALSEEFPFPSSWPIDKEIA